MVIGYDTLRAAELISLLMRPRVRSGPKGLFLAGVLLLSTPATLHGMDSVGRDAIAGDDWTAYNKTLDGQRFSPLSQINGNNVSKLAEVCRIELAHRGSFEAGPLAIDGVLYVTVEGDTVALDATNCGVKWRYKYHHQQAGYVAINRGLAFANGVLFRGTEDARVLALNAKTGDPVWLSVAGDANLGEYIAGAPMVWNGLVYVATAGSEWGIKGRVLAFDAQTGREVWRFNTIPTGHEQGAETWKNAQWASHGGGGSWSSFAVDPVSAELFVPVGNPVPDFSPQDRPGSNLFTDSVVVLDARSGVLRWWYQLKANDGMDWDLGAAPMLYRDGEDRDMVAVAGKDGYLHAIDRVHQTARFRVPTTTVGTTSGSAGSTVVCPGIGGGSLWNGPAFAPDSQTIFTGALDFCSIVSAGNGEKYKTSHFLAGGAVQPVGTPSGWISAFDATSGQLRWKYHTDSPVVAGITPTAGGLLMTGDNAGNFLVLDSKTGQLLKKMPMKGSLSGGVVTYLVNNVQYVALDAGNVSRTSFGVAGRPAVVILKVAEEQGNSQGRTDAVTEHGRDIYQRDCLACHGYDFEGMKGVNLKAIGKRMTRAQIIDWIRHPAPPMPTVFPDPLDEQDRLDLEALASYLMEQ